MGIYDGNQTFYQMDMIPDPKDCTFGRQGRTYDPSNEAKFDPSVHLDLQLPKSISIFEGEGFKTVTDSSYKNHGPDSKFAHSEVFKVLSEEGATEARRICLELKKYAVQDQRSCKLRGIWYLSPFLKDFMSCPEYLDHMEKIFGEPVLPSLYLSNAQLNIGAVGKDKKVDQWHFDSANFVAVLIFSNIDNMIGGELEILKCPRAVAEEKLRTEILPEDKVTVSYKSRGYCIAVQGSELCHHVTPVQAADEDRMSFVISFHPANPYHKDKCLYRTMKRADPHADFEYFRQRAWMSKTILEDYVKNVQVDTDVEELEKKLRDVAAELTRTADLLSGKISDQIGFYQDGKFVKY